MFFDTCFRKQKKNCFLATETNLRKFLHLSKTLRDDDDGDDDDVLDLVNKNIEKMLGEATERLQEKIYESYIWFFTPVLLIKVSWSRT